MIRVLGFLVGLGFAGVLLISLHQRGRELLSEPPEQLAPR